ncbi:hypothetical protein [Flavobacterium sp.]|uniref:hypothetical protein n=1 Tax=Flavobacterium sp. TaxID=239 RepID=UPI0026360D52|nr:hypothetical protein [Flavobacterium sp.]
MALIVLILMQVFAHYNLMVSLKYEADYVLITTEKNLSEETKSKWLEETRMRENEIMQQQKKKINLIWIFSILLLINILVTAFYRRRKSKV